MPQLEYRTYDGAIATICLPDDTGTTIRMVRYETPSAPEAQMLWQSFDAVKVQWQAREFDHRIGVAPNGLYIVIVVQPAVCKAETRKGMRGVPQGASDDASRRSDMPVAVLLLHRSLREWLLVVNEGRMCRIDDEIVPPLRILRDGMKIQLDEWQFSFHELERGIVDAARLAGPDGLQAMECPYCRGPFEIGEEYIICPSCHTAQHGECWHEYGDRCCGPVGCQYGMQPSSRDSEAT